MAKRKANIDKAVIRMYRMGTGDCFVIKYYSGTTPKFQMMIDGGVWSGSKDHLSPFIEDLKEFVDNHIHLLIITHEHQDHVLAFQRCEKLFTKDFKVDQIFMGWTEKDGEKDVEEWKEDFGDKKKALGIAATKWKEILNEEDYKAQFAGDRFAANMLAARVSFSDVLSDFADLHMSLDGKIYKGGLKGMEVVKDKIANDNIRYLKPGEILEDIENLEGVRIFVLGPPTDINQVKKEHGEDEESYQHNKDLNDQDIFTLAALHLDARQADDLPFDDKFLDKGETLQKKLYHFEGAEWRKIDYDWLLSAGTLALRMNSYTNNLSLVLAIEFTESGKVMLFPGDAEYGSWESWHKINWTVPSKNPDKHLTEDLLNRTIFYKVAHHISHNGTARRKGLEMMTHKDLSAMATLDYNVISNGWKSTMPNRAIIQELLTRTKGRLMIMNEKNLYYDFSDQVDLSDKITEARLRMTVKEQSEFEKDFTENPLYLEYKIWL